MATITPPNNGAKANQALVYHGAIFNGGNRTILTDLRGDRVCPKDASSRQGSSSGIPARQTTLRYQLVVLR